MVTVNLPMRPEIFILGIFPENMVHCSSTCRFIDMCSSKVFNSYVLEESGKATYCAVDQ